MRPSLMPRIPKIIIISIFILNLGFTVGALRNAFRPDYLGFYATARLASQHPSEVYSENAQRQSQASILGAYHPFLHLPHELAIFMPISMLPMNVSLWTWRALSLLFFAASCYLLGPKCWRFAAVMVFWLVCLLAGQDSILLLLLLVLAYRLLPKHEGWSGIVIAVALFKPQIALIIAGAMFLNRRWRFTAGFAIGVLAIVLASITAFGPRVFIDLSRLTVRSQDPAFQEAMGVRPWQYPTLRGLGYIAHQPRAALVVSFLVLAVMSWKWMREKELSQLFSTAIVTGCVLAFNWHNADLTVLLIPMVLTPSVSLLVLLFSQAMFILSPIHLQPYLAVLMLLALGEYVLGRWRIQHDACRVKEPLVPSSAR